MSNIYYLYAVPSVTIDDSRGVASGISGEDGWCDTLSKAQERITTMDP
jgi:hypothetical protein